MRRVKFASSLAALCLLAACSSTSEDVILVSAASSLTDAFAALTEEFEERNPGVEVTLNTGGSSTLREQILEGAPTDVFASANLSTMETLVAEGLTDGTPVGFATNRLQIAVPGGNPADIGGLEDFADETLLIGLCSPGVPCGEFAIEALARAGVTPSVDTEEPDVRSLLAKIEAGELDAGITYVTDVLAMNGRVQGIEIPPQANVEALYPISVLADAPNPELARRFVEFVLSDDGQAILLAHGFGLP